MLFDFGKLLLGNSGEVREIEAQMFGIDKRTRLLDVLPQNLAQRSMQEMGAGMVAANSGTGFCIHHGIDKAAQLDWLAEMDLVRAHALHRLPTQNIANNHVVVVRIEPAGIAHLAAGIGVKRGVIEHDLHGLAGICLRHPGAILDDGQHFAVL